MKRFAQVLGFIALIGVVVWFAKRGRHQEESSSSEYVPEVAA
jgi:hypothetical protein